MSEITRKLSSRKLWLAVSATAALLAAKRYVEAAGVVAAYIGVEGALDWRNLSDVADDAVDAVEDALPQSVVDAISSTVLERLGEDDEEDEDGADPVVAEAVVPPNAFRQRRKNPVGFAGSKVRA